MRSVNYLPYLRAFEAVARLRSVRQAGLELGLSPSAVSLQMKKLSEATGLKLLEKAGRGVRLSQEGREFSLTVSRSLSSLSAAVDSASQQTSNPDRQALTVALPPSLSLAWLMSTVVGFAEEQGIRRLTAMHCMGVDDVDWNNADIAIVYDNPPFAGKWWQLLSEVRLRAVCSPVLFPRLERQRRGRTLTGITFLHEDEGEEWGRWSLASGIELDGNANVYFPSVASAVTAAINGHGLALASDVLTWSYLNLGQLIQPFTISLPASRAYYFVCPQDRLPSALLEPLIARIVDHLGASTGRNPATRRLLGSTRKPARPTLEVS